LWASQQASFNCVSGVACSSVAYLTHSEHLPPLYTGRLGSEYYYSEPVSESGFLGTYLHAYMYIKFYNVRTSLHIAHH